MVQDGWFPLHDIQGMYYGNCGNYALKKERYGIANYAEWSRKIPWPKSREMWNKLFSGLFLFANGQSKTRTAEIPANDTEKAGILPWPMGLEPLCGNGTKAKYDFGMKKINKNLYLN